MTNMNIITLFTWEFLVSLSVGFNHCQHLGQKFGDITKKYTCYKVVALEKTWKYFDQCSVFDHNANCDWKQNIGQNNSTLPRTIKYVNRKTIIETCSFVYCVFLWNNIWVEYDITIYIIVYKIYHIASQYNCSPLNYGDNGITSLLSKSRKYLLPAIALSRNSQ